MHPSRHKVQDVVVPVLRGPRMRREPVIELPHDVNSAGVVRADVEMVGVPSPIGPRQRHLLMDQLA